MVNENDIIDAEFADDDEDAGNEAFTLVHEKRVELETLLSDPDAAGSPPQALAAMKHIARELLDAVNSLSLVDFEDEYPEVE
jgi:hypothetical protein